MPGAFLFRKKAYPKDEGAQAEVAVLNVAVQTNGGSADSRNFVKRNVKRSDSLDSSFRGASETSETGIHRAARMMEEWIPGLHLRAK